MEKTLKITTYKKYPPIWRMFYFLADYIDKKGFLWFTVFVVLFFTTQTEEVVMKIFLLLFFLFLFLILFYIVFQASFSLIKNETEEEKRRIKILTEKIEEEKDWK